jgi:hypothetical protein
MRKLFSFGEVVDKLWITKLDLFSQLKPTKIDIFKPISQ